jgi:hypothetical protein
MIYSDKRGAISKLMDDQKYKLIAEVWSEHGTLLAALFDVVKSEEMRR